MKKLQNNLRFVLIFGIFLALSFLAVACSGSPEPLSEAEAETKYQVVLPAIENNDNPITEQAYPDPAIEPQVGEVSASNAAYPVPEEPVEAPAPIRRTELTATDPAVVSLASGDIQLIEFFAFW